MRVILAAEDAVRLARADSQSTPYRYAMWQGPLYTRTIYLSKRKLKLFHCQSKPKIPLTESQAYTHSYD